MRSDTDRLQLSRTMSMVVIAEWPTVEAAVRVCMIGLSSTTKPYSTSIHYHLISQSDGG